MTNQPISVSIATPFNSEFSLASLAESALDEHEHARPPSASASGSIIVKQTNRLSSDQGYHSGTSGSSTVSDEDTPSTYSKHYGGGTATRTILSPTTFASSSSTATAEESMASPPVSPLSTSSSHHSQKEILADDADADENENENENNNNNGIHTSNHTDSASPVPKFVLQTSSMSQDSPSTQQGVSHTTFSDRVQIMGDSEAAMIVMQHEEISSGGEGSSYAEGGHDSEKDSHLEDQQLQQRYLDPNSNNGQTLIHNHVRSRTVSGSDTDIDRERDFRTEREATTPTLEEMGLEGLDELGIRMLLHKLFEVIQEKDRDLGMAAVMGQDLVETNASLKAKLEHILTQLRQLRVHRTRQLTPPRTIILSPPPELPIGSGVLSMDGADDDGGNSGDENWVDDYEPSHSLLHVASSPSSSGAASSSFSYPNSPSTVGPFSHHHHNISFRRSASHSGIMRSRSRQDIEKLATLEDLNSELQAKVDATTKELKQGRRQAFKRSRKIEKELKAVKDELDRTTIKAVDLEEQNGRLIEASKTLRMRRIQLKNQLPPPGSIPGSTMVAMAVEMQGDEMTLQEMLAEDNRIFEELRDRLQSLDRKNAQLAHQKTESDKRAQQLAQDLADGQADNEDLLTNLCGYSDLRIKYEEQSAHVAELENTVKELQNTISVNAARLSQMNSPMLSPTVPSSPVQAVWRRDDADFKALKTILHGSSPGPMAALRSPGLKGQRRPRRTLLAELESEWFRDVSFFGPPRVAEQPHNTVPTIHMESDGDHHHHNNNSKRAIKNHRHESESEFFTDDTGGRVKGWRRRIQDLDYSDEACESSSCVRKQRSGRTQRRHRFKFAGESDTDHHDQLTHGEESDGEQFQLRRRGNRRRRRSSGSNSGSIFGSEDDPFEVDDGELSDCSCSDPEHDHVSRPDSPGCCCHLYEDEYSGYSSFDEDNMHMLHDRDDEESLGGWAHFEDHDASSLGYDQKRDGYYLGRRPRRGIIGMVQSVFLLVRLIWRWCRFIGILSTALGIAIYRGPDALLTDGHY